MPRQPNGTYELPLPPVVSGTTVEATWANTSFADFAQALTDSLSRTQQGNMSEPLLLVDGTVSAPGLGFGSEANSGLYRDGPGDIYMTVLGVPYMRWTDDNGVQFSDDNGATWKTVGDATKDETITAFTWDANILTGTRADGDLTVEIDVFDRFKSDGSIRHLSVALAGVVATAVLGDATRFTLSNNGNSTLVFDRPTGIDPDLGENYCVEGSVLITNTATPGIITLDNDAGSIPAANILGTQNTLPNGIMVLSYLIHRHAGDTYDEVYSWAS
jgi:hypothetical protein